MIGFILGTSEGKKLLSLINKYTSDIVISTATSYGGELLKDFKFKHLNTKPLNEEEMIALFEKFNVKVLVDGSHPYAKEVSKTCNKVCDALNIEYIRYERPSVLDGITSENLIRITEYSDLEKVLSKVDGNILNTTGSRNIEKIMKLNIKKRIIHRVLPSVKVMEECLNLGVKVEDLIAIKGPVGYELNKAFIDEYNAKALISKDSGSQGGTYEKFKAAEDKNIKFILLEREKTHYKNVFNSEEEVINYIVQVTNFISDKL